jgi:hypothetical protein
MIVRPYRITEPVRRLAIVMQRGLDPRDPPVQERQEVPVPAHLLPDEQTWRASRDAALNELIELGVSMGSFVHALREMLKADPSLISYLTGRAHLRAAALRFRGLV